MRINSTHLVSEVLHEKKKVFFFFRILKLGFSRITEAIGYGDIYIMKYIMRNCSHDYRD